MGGGRERVWTKQPRLSDRRIELSNRRVELAHRRSRWSGWHHRWSGGRANRRRARHRRGCWHGELLRARRGTGAAVASLQRQRGGRAGRRCRRVQPFLLGLRLPHPGRLLISLRKRRQFGGRSGPAARGGAQQLVKVAKCFPAVAPRPPHRASYAQATGVKGLRDLSRRQVFDAVPPNGDLPQLKGTKGARAAPWRDAPASHSSPPRARLSVFRGVGRPSHDREPEPGIAVAARMPAWSGDGESKANERGKLRGGFPKPGRSHVCHCGHPPHL